MPQTVDERPVRVHILVTGRVQAVGFRAFAAQTATRLDLVGGVRNLEDGRVELDVEGKKA
ncbi:acylphosphatase, partial [Nitrospira sp. BLG_2]|uniref:acylphosphatase n=1 Tax=Nitrospira sp. BLG_2 TaxID=3397507 RepID=UPI003B99FF7D